jgi:cupin superfamily acireductone dioxygenase involved in methionine salvage
MSHLGTVRKERLANNEAMFRLANDRMADWDEVRASEAVEHYFCECADADCREKIALRKGDYEAVRSDPRHFFTVQGHELWDVETVIETHDGWVVVEKNPEVTEIVQTNHPRLHQDAAP